MVNHMTCSEKQSVGKKSEIREGKRMGDVYIEWGGHCADYCKGKNPRKAEHEARSYLGDRQPRWENRDWEAWGLG